MMSDNDLCPFCGEPEKVTMHDEPYEFWGANLSYTRYENEGCENIKCPNETLECLSCNTPLTPQGYDYYECSECGQAHFYNNGGFILCERKLNSLEKAKAFFVGLKAKHKATKEVFSFDRLRSRTINLRPN
jgi:hypothetical protein